MIGVLLAGLAFLLGLLAFVVTLRSVTDQDARELQRRERLNEALGRDAGEVLVGHVIGSVLVALLLLAVCSIDVAP